MHSPTSTTSPPTTLRAEIASWPDGVFESEAFVDTDGIDLDRRIRYHVRVEKKGDRLHFDYSGCDDQVIGPINIRPALAERHRVHSRSPRSSIHPSPSTAGSRA